MRSSTLSLLALVAAVQACDSVSPCQKSADAVPACAKSCIESAAVTNAKCQTTDFACQCSKSVDIQGAALACVTNGCGLNTALQVVSSVQALCSCVTASPTTPCTSATASTTAPGSSTATGTGSGSAPPTTTGQTSPTASSGSTGKGSTGTGSTGPITSSPATTGTPTSSCGAKADCGAVASSAVPSCAQQCFASGAPKVGCAVTDFSCQCQPAAQQSLSSILVPCVATACPASVLPNVIAGASSVCACALAPGGSCGVGTATTTVVKTGTTTVPCSTSKSKSASGTGSPCPGCTGTKTTGGGGGSSAPSKSVPVTASAGRTELSIVAAVFASFWAVAVAL
ncbi:Histone-lysine N-methyltransferase [Purpureocillium lavendulum]|uniref:Histone-lysine N-methyltransferase n=1 Tax=Purpureocillium lavendulum TaxID=1247861 RepID=A0AB34G6J5_9HYPO|nr:Histone-lysine N-methyltransferase [Purpureocillium lavendulum]